jgi:hypothetical protein
VPASHAQVRRLAQAVIAKGENFFQIAEAFRQAAFWHTHDKRQHNPGVFAPCPAPSALPGWFMRLIRRFFASLPCLQIFNNSLHKGPIKAAASGKGNPY